MRSMDAHEEAVWMEHRMKLWRDIPLEPLLIMLRMVRREEGYRFRDAVMYAMERPNPSPELIALAVEAQLLGK